MILKSRKYLQQLDQRLPYMKLFLRLACVFHVSKTLKMILR